MKSISGFIFSLILLVIVLMTYGVLRVMLADQSAVAASLTERIQEANSQTARIAYAQSELTRLANDEAAVQGYFVSDTSAVTFINDLQARGQALGATVNISAVNTGKSGTSPVFTLSISIQGSFDAVMRTLGSIEFAPYDIAITNATVNLQQGGQWTAAATLTAGSLPVSH